MSLRPSQAKANSQFWLDDLANRVWKLRGAYPIENYLAYGNLASGRPAAHLEIWPWRVIFKRRQAGDCHRLNSGPFNFWKAAYQEAKARGWLRS